MAHERTVVGFEGLKVICIIGIYPHERIEAQPLLIDLKVSARRRDPLESKDRYPTIDYERLARYATEAAVLGQHQLLETLAAQVLDRLEAEFDLSWAWICLRKPQAIPEAACALIAVERHFKETSP